MTERYDSNTGLPEPTLIADAASAAAFDKLQELYASSTELQHEFPKLLQTVSTAVRHRGQSVVDAILDALPNSERRAHLRQYVLDGLLDAA